MARKKEKSQYYKEILKAYTDKISSYERRKDETRMNRNKVNHSMQLKREKLLNLKSKVFLNLKLINL